MNFTYLIYFIVFPIMGALLGWFTNYLAVKMLFHPKEPYNFLNLFSIQGIFPKHQNQMAKKIGKIVSNELLSFDDLKNQIITPSALEKLYLQINKGLAYLIDTKLTEKYRLLSLIANKKTRIEIREQVMNEVRNRIPTILDNQIKEIEQNVNIEEMIASKFSGLSSDRLEMVLKEILSKEFKFIEILGGVIGFIIGIFQAIITVIIS